MNISKYIKISIILFLLLVTAEGLQGQTSVRDTMAFIRVKNSKLIDFQTLQFDLYIERQSDRWLKFVNGTFSLNFEDTTYFKILKDDPENFSIYQVRTELRQDIAPGNDIPTTGYRTDFQIYDNRLTITILGPDNFDDCQLVNKDHAILIGTYILKTNKERFPSHQMKWIEPYKRYQACAFKLFEDSTLYDNYLYFSDDNVSMEDENSITYLFTADSTRDYFELDYFKAEYMGNMKSRYYWRTLKEYDILGYSVYRGLKFPESDEIVFDRLMGTWRPGTQSITRFVVSEFTSNPRNYYYFEDEIEFRGGGYCYQLIGSFMNPDGSVQEIPLDTACIASPRAVISYASASPERFSYETSITYTVDDDVYLTAYLSDLLGKELKILDVPTWGLLENKEVKRGTYEFKFRAPDLASQGFYNIRFVATPINDPTVEKSFADVKLQLIK